MSRKPKTKREPSAPESRLLETWCALNTEYARGYADGFDDGVAEVNDDEPVMAWAIVDRTKEKVRFDTSKPKILGEDDVLIPLFVRPERTKRLGRSGKSE